MVRKCVCGYSYGLLSGEDADALVDPHLMLELRGLLLQAILNYLDEHLLVHLPGQLVHGLVRQHKFIYQTGLLCVNRLRFL